MLGYGVSWRYLQIGNLPIWLKYSSKNDWRSNYGEVEIEITSIEKECFHPRINYPLFAVDFVSGKKLYAIDFNTAPQIKGTGIEDILSAKKCAEHIKTWFKNKNDISYT